MEAASAVRVTDSKETAVIAGGTHNLGEHTLSSVSQAITTAHPAPACIREKLT